MPQAGADYPEFYGDFLAWFGDDEAGSDYLDWLRWPDGHVKFPSGSSAVEGCRAVALCRVPTLGVSDRRDIVCQDTHAVDGLV